ncbi:uncharacterized protein LOC105837004 [Monomorium pharaonis]|uniref:uncharacterized protein LOC105837004 n=1 Tax=Monomorium pharaonis TaxID=307658 RepID=UPI001747A66D|nr:uncharacterized protein LOC105837004 [Monomorium pharaonis]
MHKIQSINNYSNYKNKDKIHKIKYIDDMIQDLENYGPAGLIHIAILSNILERPIKIWNTNGSLNKIIGRKKPGQSIDIEYHANDSEQIGHWTLRGGKDPDNVIIHLNSCLFSVIGSQIGQDPLQLRRWTIVKLKDNFQNLIKWLDKILQWDGDAGVFLMIGGARYSREGTSENDAKRILDDSENNPSHQNGSRGHSRERHVVDEGKGVQVYTAMVKCETKHAFVSREDQNYAIHRALISVSGQQALEELNRGAIQVKRNIGINELKEENRPFPKASIWYNGKEKVGPRDITSVTIILRHKRDKYYDQNAEPFVLTAFPYMNDYINFCREEAALAG